MATSVRSRPSAATVANVRTSARPTSRCPEMFATEGAAEDDDAVGWPLRRIPRRKSRLHRLEQQPSKRRKSAYCEQYDGSQHQLAAKGSPSRGQENRAEETQADQEIGRQQHRAKRFGEHEKQGKPRGMSGTASYPTPALTRSARITHHHLHSSPETCHWGFFEARLKPVLTITSGDDVTIDTTTHAPHHVPHPPTLPIPPSLLAC